MHSGKRQLMRRFAALKINMNTHTKENISNGWIHSKEYDLSLILGGAFITLLFALLSLAQPTLIPFLFWVWVVGFEGSHFWATWARTYFDSDFRRTHSRLLIGSLLFFALPVLALTHRNMSGSDSLVNGFGFFIFSWSLYHNARQHYGFMSIYARKSESSNERSFGRLKALLYASVIIPQAYFFSHFKFPLFRGADPETIFKAQDLDLSTIFLLLCAIGSLLALLSIRNNFFNRGDPALKMAWTYTLGCWVFYTLMFFVITQFEPIYFSPKNVPQMLMVVTVMNSLFHNIQYHAIVWHYGNTLNQKRINKPDSINGIFTSSKVYVTFSIVLGLLFGFVVWNLGDWPSPTGAWTPSPMADWAYVIFFGIIGHHFYLDQKIWRPSRQTELRATLGLGANHAK